MKKDSLILLKFGKKDKTVPKNKKTKIIRRYNFKYKLKKVIKKKQKKDKIQKRSSNYQTNQKEKQRTQLRQKLRQEQWSNDKSAKKTGAFQKQKLRFDISQLPKKYQKLYRNKKKVVNSALMLSGVKFIANPTMKDIAKWKKQLIVYQINPNFSNLCHFGLLIKYKDKLITFDGLRQFWPFCQVEPSYHWERQRDSWSCAYRALFWINRIRKIGIQRWVEQFQDDEAKGIKIIIDCE